MHGAITESNHVFIRHGLEYISVQKSSISILEVGFGTGLNAFLTYLYCMDHDLSIHYTGIEKFPLSRDIVSQLNYVTLLKAEVHSHIFEQMHTSREFEHKNFHFNLFIGDVVDFASEHPFDLVYFDAFAPGVQPEMWETQVFQKIKNYMSSEGILVTYCAQGQFKRTLKHLGFELETLAGPPGKREMVRAIFNS